MAEEYTWPDGMTPEGQETVARVVWVIQDLGRIESDDGRATGLVLAELERRGVTMTVTHINKILKELEGGGRYGEFVARDVRGKRTFLIEALRNPAIDPFPPNPWSEADDEDWDYETETGDEAASDDGDIVDVGPLTIGPATEVAEIAGAEVALIEESLPISVVDKLLYVQSVLADCVQDLATAPLRDLDAKIDDRLREYTRMMEDNERLRREVRERDEAIAKLQRMINSNGLARVRV